MTHVTFPQIGRSFAVGAGDARLSVSVATFAYALAFFVFGPLADRHDERAMIRAATLAIASLVALATVVHSFAMFLCLLGAAAAAAAAVPAAMFALLPRIAPPERTGVCFGLLIGGTVAGITLGRSLTGVLAGLAGWHRAFLAVAALNLASLLLLPLVPRDTSRRQRGSLARSYAGAARIVLQRSVPRLLGIGALVFFGYLGVITFLTQRLHAAPFRYGSTAIGLISAIGLVGLVGAPLAGRLINRIGAPRVVVGSLGTILLGTLALAIAASTPVVLLGVVLVFLGVFSCQPAVLFLIAGEVSSEHRGAASSIYLLCCLCAGSAAPAVLGPVWSGGGWSAIVGASLSASLLAALLAAPRRAAAGARAAQGVAGS
jgi:YNFM family putative membrane transporter